MSRPKMTTYIYLAVAAVAAVVGAICVVFLLLHLAYHLLTALGMDGFMAFLACFFGFIGAAIVSTLAIIGFAKLYEKDVEAWVEGLKE